jgi:hypothetical protein
MALMFILPVGIALIVGLAWSYVAARRAQAAREQGKSGVEATTLDSK